jgi:hypothetical protein
LETIGHLYIILNGNKYDRQTTTGADEINKI